MITRQRKKICDVWSAAPTPLTEDLEIDEASIARLAEHHEKLGINGVFIAGTCGEGPWLSDALRSKLARLNVKYYRNKMPVAMQVTDNSALRILDHIKRAADAGVDVAVIAPPFFQINATQNYLKKLYLEVIEASPLPIGIYHLGKNAKTIVEPETIGSIIAHPRVVLIKDSSSDPLAISIILKARNQRKGELFALNGNEFDCVTYAQAGYDGVLLGGACFNGLMANEIIRLTKLGQIEDAKQLQERMNNLMLDVFGGKDIHCWLAGQKTLLVKLGIFSTNKTIINYQVDVACEKAIDAAIEREKDWLLPEIQILTQEREVLDVISG
ncbi:MAG: dihydrodipicolinate synthase family protein [Victivallaceae bacterium]|nr:dihydrodipicolinate synthase family protein [Victivallaceae bacterium]